MPSPPSASFRQRLPATRCCVWINCSIIDILGRSIAGPRAPAGERQKVPPVGETTKEYDDVDKISARTADVCCTSPKVNPFDHFVVRDLPFSTLRSVQEFVPYEQPTPRLQSILRSVGNELLIRSFLFVYTSVETM